MRSVSLRLVDLERNPLIPLGFEGENEYTTVRVDCKKIFDEHPDAVPTLAVTPPEGDSYPAVIVRDGDIVSWTVTDSDLVHSGTGEIQFAFVIDETIIGKTYKARTKVLDSIVPSGEAPTPIQNWLIQAAAALQALPTEVASSVAALMGAMVGVGETLDPDDDVTVNYDPINNTLTIGVPHGRDGEDGHTPAITANKVGKVATFYVDGVAVATISDGTNGNDGTTFTPSVSEEGVISWTNDGGKPNPTPRNIKGDPGDPTTLIDDTSTALNRTWSAKKLDEEKQSLLTEINSRYTKPNTGIPATDMAEGVQTSLGKADSAYQKPQTGIPASDLASGVIPAVPVQDVQINGASILDAQGVASVPVANNYGNLGVVKGNETYGTKVHASNGSMMISKATDEVIKAGIGNYNPIVAANQHIATFYALAKLAGADMASSSNPVGQFTDDALVKIQKMLGVYEAPWELIREDTVTNATEADIDIIVDGDGDPLELTDVRLFLLSDSVDSQFIKGDYGRVIIHSGTLKYNCYIGAYTQAVGASSRGSAVSVEQKDGMITKEWTPNSSVGANNAAKQTRIDAGYSIFTLSTLRTFDKITVTSVTGKLKYILFGKRKWN